MKRRKRNVAMTGLALVLASAMVTATQTGPLNAQVAMDAIRVGTYDPQAAFEQHPAQTELMEIMDSLQSEMQEAQMEGDAIRMQQLQQQFEEQRTQTINRFHADVEAAVPEAAEAAGVVLVAVEIVYFEDDVEVTDITPQLVDAFPSGAGEGAEAPLVPQFPAQ